MSKRRTNDHTQPIWREMAQVMEQYPFSRPTVYQWINSGLIESKLVPVTGANVSITTVTRRIAGRLFRGCCWRATKTGNYKREGCASHCACSYHFVIAVWSTKKLLTSSGPERHDHGASSLPAAVTGPLTFFPLGENC